LLGTAEQRAVRRVLASGLLAEGQEVGSFEREMARKLGRRHAAAVNSGTAALHLALAAVGVGAGDRVALPSYVCPALLHAVALVGAEPILVDVDPATFNLDPDDLRKRLRSRTKAVIVPHMFGLPASFREIEACGVPIIEDCALALGTKYRKRPVGSLGVLSVVSFYATKMMATGEGGMVLGNRSALLQEVLDRRSYDGRSRHRLRFNYKMTDLQAALGRVQLRRLTDFVRRRRQLASFYSSSLAGGPWDLPSIERNHSFYRFVTRPRRGAKRLLAELTRRGIEARRPVFQPLHRYLGLGDFPGAEEAYRRAVSIPLYPALSSAEAERVVRATLKVGHLLSRRR
jgi:dTDP-4-amino-4,6-dideoxygalactose transaminase